jgi:hypothetical protein
VEIGQYAEKNEIIEGKDIKLRHLDLKKSKYGLYYINLPKKGDIKSNLPTLAGEAFRRRRGGLLLKNEWQMWRKAKTQQ